MTGHIVVIGGGAAGMMAALQASAGGFRVTLIEKNEKLGKKLYLTGKGRCNFTNDSGPEEHLAHVVSNKKFLYSAFYGFGSADIMRLMQDNGLRIKTERGGRVFPASDHASDVTKTFEKCLRRQGVSIHLNEAVTGIKAEGCAVTGISTDKCRLISADAVIIACGGLSYPSTGSDGDGHTFARSVGHKVTDCRPALVPFNTEEGFVHELMGLSLKNVKVTLIDGKNILYSETGEMLFTHFGVSGPLILSASSFASKRLQAASLRLNIDLKPALTAELLEARIQRYLDKESNRHFRNSLSGLYPSKLIPVIVRLSGIDPEKKACSITREERHSLAMLTKCFPLTVTGTRGYNEAIITQGGVDVKQVDPGTMESRLVAGLYFAGEVLDLDALTGGYNLQIAWSTGYAAGKAAAEKILKMQTECPDGYLYSN